MVTVTEVADDAAAGAGGSPAAGAPAGGGAAASDMMELSGAGGGADLLWADPMTGGGGGGGGAMDLFSDFGPGDADEELPVADLLADIAADMAAATAAAAAAAAAPAPPPAGAPPALHAGRAAAPAPASAAAAEPAPAPPDKEAAERREAFALLRPACARLLQHRADAAGMRAVLADLAAAIAACPPGGLAACWDYVAFPLFIALDSAAAIRTRRAAAAAAAAAGAARGQADPAAPAAAPPPAVPAAASDAVAEALTGCLLALVRKAPPGEADQLAPLLEKLLPLLQLPPAAASEETRLRALECLEAALLPPAPPPGPPPSTSSLDVRAPAAAAPPAAAALLARPGGAALAGALIMSCLDAAEAELALGPSGSRAARAAALRGARAAAVAVAAAGDDGAVAFFLPGLVSGFSKQLIASGKGAAGAGQTGAGGGAAAVTAALDGLVDAILLVLGDDVIAPLLAAHPEAAAQLRGAPAAPGGGAAGSEGEGNGQAGGAAAALLALERMSLSISQGPGAPGGGDGGDAGPSGARDAGRAAAPPPPAPSPPQPEAAQRRRELHAARDAEWLLASSRRVQTMLALALPPLMTHPRPAVRLAAASAAARLLGGAGDALRGSWQALTEVLLTLAQDEWPQVSGFCTQWLAGEAPGGGGAVNEQLQAGSGGVGGGGGARLGQLLGRLARELLPAVKGGAEQGALAARRLATALMCSGPEVVAAALLDAPSTLDQLVASLVQCFTLDPSGAALLLHSPVAPTGPFAAAPAGAGAGAAPAAGGAAAGAPAAAAAAALRGAALAPAPPELPRAPLAPAYLTTPAAYAAVASVARSLGRLARLADPSGLRHLRAIADALESRARAAQARQPPPGAAAGGGGAARAAARGAGAAGGSWQCEAAAAVAVAAEVLFGASGALEPPAPGPARGQQQQQQQQQQPGSGPPPEPSSGSTPSNSGSSSTPALRGVPPAGAPDPEFESVVTRLLELITNERLWGQPTSQPPPGDAGVGGAGAPPLPAQVLGENALLLRALCDAAGASARCLGARSAGRPLRAVLLPLLERLGDPCALVSNAAAGALAWVCVACGYGGGLKELVGANADYVIDGLCARLRALRRSPRAAQLLAALLQRCGVAPELLPLMAEPLRGALAGLSVLSRHEAPGLAPPFLQVLRCVALGAGEEATQLAAAWADVDAQARRVAAAEGLGGAPGGGAGGGGSGGGGAAAAAGGADAGAADGDSSGGGGGGIEEVRAYFLSRLARHGGRGSPPGVVLEEDADGGGGGKGGVNGDGGGGASGVRKLLLPPAQLEHLEALWRRAHGAAALAGAAADAAAPLLLARGLRSSVLAHEVAAAALDALAAATAAAEIESELFESVLSRGPGAALKPVRPGTPKLLPAVAALWGPLLAALRGAGGAPAAEASLGLLERIAELAGAPFMARRMQKEALPILFRLLRDGPAAPRRDALLTAGPDAGSGGGGGGGAAEPALGMSAAAARSAVLLGLEPGASAGGEAGAPGDAADGGRSPGGDAAMSSGGGAGGHAARAAHLMSAVVPAAPDAAAAGALAPAALARARVAVLRCLERVCASERARGALAGAVWDVAAAAAPFLSDAHPLALREAAARLLAAAALADADAVWLLLYDLAAHGPDGDAAAAAAAAAAPGAPMGLPLPRQLLPPPPRERAGSGARRGGPARAAAGASGGSGGGLTLELAQRCGRRAGALLARLEVPGGACAAGEAAWDAKAQQQLDLFTREASY